MYHWFCLIICRWHMYRHTVNTHAALWHTDMLVWQWNVWICVNLCVLPWQYSTHHHHHTGLRHWVGRLSESRSSSQSAEQSAGRSHMSYLGLCFSPSTCQDTRSRRRDQNKPADWSSACHQLMVTRRTALLKGQAPFLKLYIYLFSHNNNTAWAQHLMHTPNKICSSF